MWLLRVHCVIYRLVSSVNLPTGQHYKTMMMPTATATAAAAAMATTTTTTITTIPHEVLRVVPQGSVLRPLHFNTVWRGLLVADCIILFRSIVSSWEFVTAVGCKSRSRWWISNFTQLNVNKARVISFSPFSNLLGLDYKFCESRRHYWSRSGY